MQNTPRVFASTPGGGFEAPSGYEPPPGARKALPGGGSLSGREGHDVCDAVGAGSDLWRDRPQLPALTPRPHGRVLDRLTDNQPS